MTASPKKGGDPPTPRLEKKGKGQPPKSKQGAKNLAVHQPQEEAEGLAPGMQKAAVQALLAAGLLDLDKKFQDLAANREADKLAFETQLRREMQELTTPQVEQAAKHKAQFIHDVHSLNDHTRRLEFIEYAIFKSDKAEDRFEEVFRKMAELTEQRNIDMEKMQHTFQAHKEEVDTKMFGQEQKLSRVDSCEKNITSLKSNVDDLEKRFLQHSVSLEGVVNNTLAKFKESLQKLNDRVRTVDDTLPVHLDKIESNLLQIKNL